MNRSFAIRILYILIVTLGATVVNATAELSEVWDPPAITVFPDHNLTANGQNSISEMLAAGKILFLTKFNVVDGAGRPAATGDSKPTSRIFEGHPNFIRTSGPDSNSCAGCHNQPQIGGSGDFAVNVFVGAHIANPPTDLISTDVTSERNTISIFGAGAIELLAREMTQDLQNQKSAGLEVAGRTGNPAKVSLSSKGVGFGSIIAHRDGTIDVSGLEGVDSDLVIKPFGIKGISTSLREFTINALNQHHGVQAHERFGWERTGQADFDKDGVEIEFSIGQVSALVLFQAALPPPIKQKPSNEKLLHWLESGERLFTEIGCAGCHLPVLPLVNAVFTEPNPYNRPGNLVPSDVEDSIRLPLLLNTDNNGVFLGEDGGVYVAAFTDLKRHRICDKEDSFFCNEKLRQDFVPTDVFLTAKLWDVGTSMPYGHRGDCSTISEAIIHHSGEAAESRNAFLKLDEDSKRGVVEFLRSLVAPEVGMVFSLTKMEEIN